MSNRIRLFIVLVLAGLSGCQTKLMPTPNIYLNGRYTLFDDDLPQELRTNIVDLLYVTDRSPEPRRDGSMKYGYGRSASLAFGSCEVEIGRDVDWETLVAASTSRKRSVALPLTVRSINEVGRLAPNPLPLVEINGELVDDPEAVARQRELADIFRAELRQRLSRTPRKQVYIFVHGFKNTFEYAAEVLAEFWHFGGRHGVPILYSWPAGSPGLLKGYTYDRESGEFTIYHLKLLIKGLSDMPEIEKIHIIAHSRGTDVAASALRELLIEERGAGRIARDTLKIGNVFLASPDMDLDVTGQRFGAERFFRVCEKLTIYVSKNDKALGIAEELFRSRQRLGQLRPEDLTETQRNSLKLMGSVDIVDTRLKTGFIGHSYFHSNPAVSADVMLLLRFGVDAGSPQRPMRQAIPQYYVIDDPDYPFVDEE